MEFRHTPVLFDECMGYLNIKKDGVYADGTLGGGGHAEGICERLGTGGTLIGIDRDQDALSASKERLEKYSCKKIFVKRSYAEIADILSDLGIDKVDGAILDLGVSSFQLDNPEKGFSYNNDAPLDMRMDAEACFSAYDVVNTYTADELSDVIRRYGEERWASRIGSFIANASKGKAIESTGELVSIIKAAIPASARREGPHPAKRTFQAIRIEVNDEIGQLETALPALCGVLAEGGRLCVISFHSLEDRLGKEAFRSSDALKKITKKPVVCGDAELSLNPRARSAKLRVVEKRRI